MQIVFTEHALERLVRRGVQVREVDKCVREGRKRAAAGGRICYELMFDNERELNAIGQQEGSIFRAITVFWRD